MAGVLPEQALLSAVRRVNLEAALLAMLCEGMSEHDCDELQATISIADHQPAGVDLSYLRGGMPVAGESL